ncbi:MAG: hypothetical protein QNK23_10075 [Crocinitomicaceae bacterium]|nr:hypothetical protein [Crocinitomicaceae bacterium]
MKQGHSHSLVSIELFAALAILVVNDWFLKSLWPGMITGKLSDFVGLFAFALFWLALFPKKKHVVVWIIAGLFVVWKSSLSQGFIEGWNGIAPFKIGRVIDYWDLTALIVIPLSLKVTPRPIIVSRIAHWSVFCIAAFAFGATSYERNYDYTQTYDFDFGKDELIQRLNELTYEDTLAAPSYLPISRYIENENYAQENQEGDSTYYYITGYDIWQDTVFFENGDIDFIYENKIPLRDTVYVSRQGVLYLSVFVYDYMPESNTSYCHYVDTRVTIEGDDSKSSITLNKIFTSNCMGIFEDDAETVEQKNLLSAFEIELIERLK